MFYSKKYSLFICFETDLLTVSNLPHSWDGDVKYVISNGHFSQYKWYKIEETVSAAMECTDAKEGLSISSKELFFLHLGRVLERQVFDQLYVMYNSSNMRYLLYNYISFKSKPY